MTVRSDSLVVTRVAVTVPGPTAVLYTVPSGVRTIVKSIRLQNPNAGAAVSVFMLIRKPPATQEFTFLVASVSAFATFKDDPCWIVLREGWEIRAGTQLPVDIQYTISGAELALP